MGTLWNREPTLIIAFVQACLALAVSFGLDLTSEQTGLIIATTGALLALLTRSQVTPSAGLPQGPPSPPHG